MKRNGLSVRYFNETLLHGLLSFLLFEESLHVNLDELFDDKWYIETLATVGVMTWQRQIIQPHYRLLLSAEYP